MPNETFFLGMFFFLSSSAVALFTFIAVAHVSQARRDERLGLYRTELLKKLAEHDTESSRQVLASMRDEELRKLGEKRHGLLLGGMIVTSVGIALMALLAPIRDPEMQVWMIGLFPFLIGISLLLFAWRGPRGSQAEAAARPPAAASDAHP